jgi:hypothetical protein
MKFWIKQVASEEDDPDFFFFEFFFSAAQISNFNTITANNHPNRHLHT